MLDSGCSGAPAGEHSSHPIAQPDLGGHRELAGAKAGLAALAEDVFNEFGTESSPTTFTRREYCRIVAERRPPDRLRRCTDRSDLRGERLLDRNLKHQGFHRHRFCGHQPLGGGPTRLYVEADLDHEPKLTGSTRIASAENAYRSSVMPNAVCPYLIRLHLKPRGVPLGPRHGRAWRVTASRGVCSSTPDARGNKTPATFNI